MKSIIKIYIKYPLLFFVFLAVFFCSCEDELLNKKTETCVVSFETFGGTEIPSQTVFVGTLIRKTEIPRKTLAFFSGWFQEPELIHGFSYSMLIEKDMKLYAKWRDGVVITYDTNGGSFVENDTVPINDFAIAPPEPFRDNSVFVTWCSDPALENEFEFNKTIVNENITLYAKWIEGVTVNFETNCDIIIPSVGLLPGGYVSEPETVLIASDSTFMGWYTDETYTIEYDFSLPVMVSKTIYAKWLPNKFITVLNGSWYAIHGFKPEYANETEVFVPSDIGGVRIARIEDEAFMNNTNITKLYIDDYFAGGNFAIRHRSFLGCTNLKSIRLSNNINSIGLNAFENCTSLDKVLDLADRNRLTSFWADSFIGCTSIEELHFPKNCTLFASGLFRNCSNLKKVYIESVIVNEATGVRSPINAANQNILENCHPDLQIFVPSDLINAYKTATNWSNYADRFRPLP